MNGSDADAQQLAFLLSVDVGTIASTDDPAVFYYTPVGL